MADETDTTFQRLTFKTNDVILKEGELSEAAYLILDGKVAVRKGDHGPNPVVLATLDKGHVIGELALFDNSPHIASVIALEDTTVSAMSREEFQRMINGMDPVMKGIVGMMVTRLRQIVQEMDHSGGKINWADWQK